MKIGVVICAGDWKNPRFYRDLPFWEQAFVVCADGGLAHAQTIGKTPDLLLGDFDSYVAPLPADVAVMRFPADKDKTDSQLAVEQCLERGCEQIFLLGAMGSRMDHTLANIGLLERIACAGAEGILLDETNEIRLVTDSLRLPCREGYSFSLIPWNGVAEGVTVTGARYPLTDACLFPGDTRAISNEFQADFVTLSIKKGKILVICAKDTEKNKNICL